MEITTPDSACADGLGWTGAVELVLTTPAHEGPVYIAGAAGDLPVSPVPALTSEGARLAAEAAGVTADRRQVLVPGHSRSHPEPAYKTSRRSAHSPAGRVTFRPWAPTS